jgi:putative transposase
VKPLPEKGYGNFLSQKVPETNVEKSIGGTQNPYTFIENLGLKPRRSTTALPLNISTFTEYMLKCSPWKKPIGFDFTPHQNKSRYCGARWAV